MTDRYQEIRDALAMGPTPGPWRADGFEVMAARGQFYGGLILGADDVVVAQMVSAANAALIAACDPDTIRALLEEPDALAKDAAKYRWALNHSRWIRGEHAVYVAIPVAREADLSCVAMRDAAIDAAMQRTSGGDHG